MLRQIGLLSSYNLKKLAGPAQRQLPVRCCSKSSKENVEADWDKPLGGYEYKDDIEPFKSRWRKPFNERTSFWRSKFDLFANRRFQANITRYDPKNFKYLSISKWWSKHKKEKIVFHQQFIEERLHILGCELAAAHFVVFRGGAVKFYNQSEWIKDDKEKNSDYDDKLPNMFDPAYTLEAIDFSNTLILYEGLLNTANLKKLKWLRFSYCGFFDNWCLDRVSALHGEALEYLDISYTNTSWHGLGAIYRLKNLKTLVLDDLSDDPDFYRMCAEIKKYNPALNIEGIPAEFLTESELSDAPHDATSGVSTKEEQVLSKAHI